jgi:hypothetical protein
VLRPRNIKHGSWRSNPSSEADLAILFVPTSHIFAQSHAQPIAAAAAAAVILHAIAGRYERGHAGCKELCVKPWASMRRGEHASAQAAAVCRGADQLGAGKCASSRLLL